MKKKDVLSLRPEFMFGYMPMIDWFEIHSGHFYCTIMSGLKHADGETKSPFHYCETTIGKDATKDAIKKFEIWWNNLSITNNEWKT